MLILNFSEQEVLKWSHTRENSIGKLVHERYLVILNHYYSLLEGVEELAVGVALNVGETHLSHSLLNDRLTEINHGRGQNA